MTSKRNSAKLKLRRSFSEQLRSSTSKAWDLLWRNVRERRLAGQYPAAGAPSPAAPGAESRSSTAGARFSLPAVIDLNQSGKNFNELSNSPLYFHSLIQFPIFIFSAHKYPNYIMSLLMSAFLKLKCNLRRRFQLRKLNMQPTVAVKPCRYFYWSF